MVKACVSKKKIKNVCLNLNCDANFDLKNITCFIENINYINYIYITRNLLITSDKCFKMSPENCTV